MVGIILQWGQKASGWAGVQRIPGAGAAKAGLSQPTITAEQMELSGGLLEKGREGERYCPVGRPEFRFSKMGKRDWAEGKADFRSQ